MVRTECKEPGCKNLTQPGHYCLMHVNSTLPKPTFQVTSLDDWAKEWMKFEEESPSNFWTPKKCECGVASVNGNKHSDYCPLYVKEEPLGTFLDED